MHKDYWKFMPNGMSMPVHQGYFQHFPSKSISIRSQEIRRIYIIDSDREASRLALQKPAQC